MSSEETVRVYNAEGRRARCARTRLPLPDEGLDVPARAIETIRRLRCGDWTTTKPSPKVGESGARPDAGEE